MRPGAGLGVEAQENVSGEKTAKEHYFRGEEQPDPDLGVPKAGVRPRCNCVGNFHGRLVHACGCRGLTARSVEDLEGVRSWLENRDRPLVLDAKVDPDICAEWLEEAFRGH